MDLFIAKELKKVWNAGPCVFFWTVGKVRNVIVSRDKGMRLYVYKRSSFNFFFFLYILFGRRPKMFFVDCIETLVHFVDWVSSS